MTTPVLAPYFFQQFLNQTGTAPAVGGKLFFYIAGTSTKQAIYADSVGTPLSNPVILDSTGSVPYLWMDPTLIYKVVLAPPNDTDPPVSAYRSEDNIQPPVNGSTIALVLTGAILGSILFPITAAETATGFTTGTLSMQYPYGNVLRYGIVPNNAGANTTNATKFAALVNASIADGPTGWIYFPNSGSVATPDNYYFGANAPFQVRDWCDIDLGGCTLTFQDSFNAAQTDMGFFVMCRNARLRNGNIVVNYNGTAGTNNGPAIRFGSRSGYPWGIYTTGIFDQDNLLANGLPLQGNLKFENLRISSNNPSVMIVYGLGGLRNVSFENVWIDGQNVQTVYGFYYEFGWSSTNGQPGTQAAWTSSHMTNLSIKNMSITNMAVGGNSYAFGMRGSYNCSIDGLYINTADNAFDLSSGEAFYYRVWAQDVTTPDRNHELRNIVVKNTTSLGALLGAAAVSGYLAATINALAAPKPS